MELNNQVRHIWRVGGYRWFIFRWPLVHVFTVVDVVFITIASTRKILRWQSTSVPRISGWSSMREGGISILVHYLTNWFRDRIETDVILSLHCERLSQMFPFLQKANFHSSVSFPVIKRFFLRESFSDFRGKKDWKKVKGKKFLILNEV